MVKNRKRVVCPVIIHFRRGQKNIFRILNWINEEWTREWTQQLSIIYFIALKEREKVRKRETLFNEWWVRTTKEKLQVCESMAHERINVSNLFNSTSEPFMEVCIFMDVVIMILAPDSGDYYYHDSFPTGPVPKWPHKMYNVSTYILVDTFSKLEGMMRMVACLGQIQPVFYKNYNFPWLMLFLVTQKWRRLDTPGERRLYMPFKCNSIKNIFVQKISKRGLKINLNNKV